jgi:hypothetical protein
MKDLEKDKYEQMFEEAQREVTGSSGKEEQEALTLNPVEETEEQTTVKTSKWDEILKGMMDEVREIDTGDVEKLVRDTVESAGYNPEETETPEFLQLLKKMCKDKEVGDEINVRIETPDGKVQHFKL